MEVFFQSRCIGKCFIILEEPGKLLRRTREEDVKEPPLAYSMALDEITEITEFLRDEMDQFLWEIHPIPLRRYAFFL